MSYRETMLKAIARGNFAAPGEFLHIMIAHDNWCNTMKGAPVHECNCDPDITFTRGGVQFQILPNGKLKNLGKVQ